jgi:hypothetical protein
MVEGKQKGSRDAKNSSRLSDRRESALSSPTTTTHPNDLWTADFKGQFRTGDGIYCYPLTVADQHTRYLLACHGLPSTKGTGVRPRCRTDLNSVLPHFWCKARSTSPAAECGALMGSAATREQRRTIGDCREAGGSMPSRCVTTRRVRRATQRAARGERVAIRRRRARTSAAGASSTD